MWGLHTHGHIDTDTQTQTHRHKDTQSHTHTHGHPHTQTYTDTQTHAAPPSLLAAAPKKWVGMGVSAAAERNKNTLKGLKYFHPAARTTFWS